MNNQENNNINDQDNRVLITHSNKIDNLESNISASTNKRIDYFDWLRILCSFSVIFLHASHQNQIICPIKSHKWKILIFYEGIVRFGVPIFFMISGAIFLEKNISFSIMLKKYIKKIYINRIFWSFFYSTREKIIKKYTYKNAFLLFLKGHYHLWYLFRICALYLITPFLKEFTKNEQLLTIFLIVNFIFGLLFQSLLTFLFYYSKTYYYTYNQILGKYELNGFLEKTLFYYIFGFYLNKINIKPLLRKIIYILGICGMIFTSGMSYYISLKKNTKINFFSSKYINVFFPSVAIFILFKYNFNDLKYRKGIKEFIQKLGRLTFGIYIIHPFVIDEFNIRFKLNNLSFQPLYSVPIISLITFLISSLIVYLIKLIPFINQYIF
jgi:surface polysaccharide O-acyltransferase-like enzyme